MNWSKFWHGRLGRPFILHPGITTGSGMPVVLLHGIGRSAGVWQPLLGRLPKETFAVKAYDLLGFGASPKPDWLDYDIDDHAASVIASIKAARFKQPVVLVGHSLGALVGVRVARLQPDLVRHVILYEMPLYEGLPDKRRYKTRLAVYRAFYEWVLKQQPTFAQAKQPFRERLGSRIAGLELTPETWQPFIKTLANSILKQTAASDIGQLRMPADVIYGSRDMLVIRGKVQTIFGDDAAQVTGHTVRSSHKISAVAATFIAARIHAAVGLPAASPSRRKRPKLVDKYLPPSR